MPRGNAGRLLINQYDLSLDTISATLEITNEPIPANNWQSSVQQMIPGNPQATLSHGGYYGGDGAGELYTAIEDNLGSTASHVSWLIDASVVGNPAYVLYNSWAKNLTIETPIDGIITLQGQWDGIMSGGYVLQDGSLVAAGNGTVVTYPAAGSTGGRAYLIVRSITGSATNATISIRSSTVLAMTTPTTLNTFTFSTSGVYTATLSGTINRYNQIVVGSMGGSTAISAVVILCINGVTM